MKSNRADKRMSEMVNNVVGDRVAYWLRMAYRDSVAKRAAQQFEVSEGTAKRWKRGIPPTSEHLSAMAKAWGWRFVEFVYSPVCAGPDYDSRLSADIVQLKDRLARLEAQGHDTATPADQSRADAPSNGADEASGATVGSRPDTFRRLMLAQEVESRRRYGGGR